MSQSEIKSIYDVFLDNGDLLEMFPHFKGVWDQDRKEFSKQYEITEHLLDDDMFDDEFTEYHD